MVMKRKMVMQDGGEGDKNTAQTTNQTEYDITHLSRRIKRTIIREHHLKAMGRHPYRTTVFIPNKLGLRFLVGLCFLLLFLPFNPTAATTDEHAQDLNQSRALTTGVPPWATGSICTPDEPSYNPAAADECRGCCQERKCHNRCLKRCKDEASSVAQNRKDYCRSYDGYEKDGPPSWTTCSDKLGTYKESHCQDYDQCVTKNEARHIADDAWYYCDGLDPPSHDCSGFGDCVYEKLKEVAVLKSKSAYNDCKAEVHKNYAEGKCDIACLPKNRRLQEDWEIFCPQKKDCADCEGCCDFYKNPGGCKDLCCKCPGRCPAPTPAPTTAPKPTPKPTPTPPPDDCTDQQCIDYSKCVYNFYEAEARKKQYEAERSCKPDSYVGGKCDYKIPEWEPSCGKRGYWSGGRWRDRDDWYDACKENDCNDILKDLQFASDHSKSSSKGRRAVCDDFWYCVNDYERYNEDSYSRMKGNEAKKDCRNCEEDGGDCKDEVGDAHEKGKDDECLSYLGGWNRSCNSYYDCWNSKQRRECEICANDGSGGGCFSKYGKCKNECMLSPFDSSCENECDVCFCESTPELGIEACQAIGDDCCKDPYGWRNDPDMRSLEYTRKCTSLNDCGSCRGNCETNNDCHNVNLCSNDPRNPKDIYDIPGCKGDPANVNVPSGTNPLSIGYCYNPNKNFPDRTDLINDCLAETTESGYGLCCGLPRFASQCGQTFNNYCDRQPDIVVIPPGQPGVGTGTGSGTPIFELAQYTGSYCGISRDEICSTCPPVDNDDGCPDNPCIGENEGCFTDFTCPGCFVQVGLTGVQRSDNGDP